MVGVFIATIDVHWMVSVPNPNQPSNIFEMHQGLWEKCSTSNMNQQCQPYIGAITQLPGALIAQRAMMIMACGLGTIATLGAISSTNIVNAGKFETNTSSSISQSLDSDSLLRNRIIGF